MWSHERQANIYMSFSLDNRVRLSEMKKWWENSGTIFDMLQLVIIWLSNSSIGWL